MARFGITPWAVVAFAFSCAMLVVSFIDLDEGIIPDVVSLPGILIGLAVSALVPGGAGFWNAFAGACLGGGLLLAVAAAYQRAAGIEGLGLGHVKLLAMIGAFGGWQSIPAVLFIASISGSLGGVAILLGPRGRARDRSIVRTLRQAHHERLIPRNSTPFGPFLALRRRHGALRSRSRPALTWVSSG